ncbi:hypothetical protein GCM10023100_28610 [Actinocorallia cavernae]|uniref:Uncharacterized protein n=2 Tax=Actinomycetes TaxID=1760 RepID=A0ABP8SN93_9ACTN
MPYDGVGAGVGRPPYGFGDGGRVPGDARAGPRVLGGEIGPGPRSAAPAPVASGRYTTTRCGSVRPACARPSSMSRRASSTPSGEVAEVSSVPRHRTGAGCGAGSGPMPVRSRSGGSWGRNTTPSEVMGGFLAGDGEGDERFTGQAR